MVGYIIVPKHTQIPIPGTYECYLIWQMDFAAVIKGTEMQKLLWIIEMSRYTPLQVSLLEGGGGSFQMTGERGYAMEAESEREKTLSR